MRRLLIVLAAVPAQAAAGALAAAPAAAPSPTSDAARSAAVHPVANAAAMHAWLERVPLTRDFPPDFAATLQGQAPAFVVEMTSAPGCLPCGDLWTKLQALAGRYGLRIGVLSRQEALLLSGRMGLPWVGSPVAWVRAAQDPNRIVPIAIGTDHSVNVARNIYLGFKMMTGVRPAIGVRAMAKFTGIVGVPAPSPAVPRK